MNREANMRKPFFLGCLLFMFSGLVRAEPDKTSAATEHREKVLGIGGLFFRAQDPKALAKWYEDNLGVNVLPTGPDKSPWVQEAGPTAFAPFRVDTKYFGDATKVWMLNFRVKNLDAMAAQLVAAGIDVKIDPEKYPNGRFARLHDPEGNPIELWEPKIESKGNDPRSDTLR
jgi:predicted enzyme related to lactoylglutathione lyase